MRGKLILNSSLHSYKPVCGTATFCEPSDGVNFYIGWQGELGGGSTVLRIFGEGLVVVLFY